MTTKTEHLQWCKERAIEIVEEGDISGGWTSFFSDMGKHHETAGNPALMLGNMMLMSGNLDTPGKMIKFIEDFN